MKRIMFIGLMCVGVAVFSMEKEGDEQKELMQFHLASSVLRKSDAQGKKEVGEFVGESTLGVAWKELLESYNSDYDEVQKAIEYSDIGEKRLYSSLYNLVEFEVVAQAVKEDRQDVVGFLREESEKVEGNFFGSLEDE